MSDVLMGIGLTAYWVVIVAVIVAVARAWPRRRQAAADVPDAEAMLDRLLAEGRIDRAEYRERMAVIAGARAMRQAARPAR